MAKLLRFLFVALLTLNASNALAFVIPEACSIFEATESQDDTCPPTCARCGCCAQPAVPVFVSMTPFATLIQPSVAVPPSDIPPTIPRDILHVPRR